MTRLLGIGLVLVVVAGCSGAPDASEATGTSATAGDDTADDGGAGDASEELGPPYLGPLTFDWPTDCVVPVVESVIQGEFAAILAWDLVLTSEGGRTEVAIENIEPVSAEHDGGTVPPRLSLMLARELGRSPSFVVDENAQVIEFRGVDELIEEMEAESGLGPDGLGPEVRPRLENAVRSHHWRAWAGLLADVAVLVEPRESTGTAVDDQSTVLESVGTTEAGQAVIVYEERLVGDSLIAAITSPVDGPFAHIEPDYFEGLESERIVTITTTTDPDTLIPDVASYTMDLTVGSQVERESREWEFGWTESDCQL